jgi:hypothetical protein
VLQGPASNFAQIARDGLLVIFVLERGIPGYHGGDRAGYVRASAAFLLVVETPFVSFSLWAEGISADIGLLAAKPIGILVWSESRLLHLWLRLE